MARRSAVALVLLVGLFLMLPGHGLVAQTVGTLSVSLSPSSGSPGTAVTASVTGRPPCTNPADTWIASWDSNSGITGGIVNAGQSSFSFSFAVPQGATQGPHTVKVDASCASSDSVGTAVFTVTGTNTGGGQGGGSVTLSCSPNPGQVNQSVTCNPAVQQSAGPIQSTIINHGDGTSDEARNTLNHVYSSCGTFTVTVTVTFLSSNGGTTSAQGSTTETVSGCSTGSGGNGGNGESCLSVAPPPTNVQLQATSPTDLTITWTPNTTNEVNFSVKVSATDNSYLMIFSAMAHTSQYIVHGLVAGESYQVYVGVNIYTGTMNCFLNSTPAYITMPASAPQQAPNCHADDETWPLDSTHLNIDAAWAKFPNCTPPAINIAVIDSGVDVNQPDLAGQVTVAADFAHNADGDDVWGHGTLNTGIIVASRNNGIGVSGVAYTSHVDMFKIQDYQNNVSPELIAQGIRAAVDNGDSVINISANVPNDECTNPLSCLTDVNPIYSAVYYAYQHSVIIVASGGENHGSLRSDGNNNGASVQTYPDAYASTFPNVVAVTSSTFNNIPAFNADPGAWITIAAPGGVPGGLIPGLHAADGTLAIAPDACPNQDLTCTYDGGTSEAAPFVTGVVALMLGANPGLTPSAVVSILQCSVEPWGLGADISGFGPGILDAEKAVNAAFAGGQCPQGPSTAAATAPPASASTGTAVSPASPPPVQPILAINGPSSGHVNQVLNFTASGTGLPADAKYLWKFGDGTSVGGSSAVAVEHAFSSTGKFTVTLTAVSSSLQQGSLTATTNVTIN